MKAGITRIAALIVFAVSFFLPAVRMQAGSHDSGALAGWMCAVVASATAPRALLHSFGRGLDSDAILVPLSGTINYLFVAICLLSFWRLRLLRLVLAALMIPGFIATWMFFKASQTSPLAGHSVWIAACILLAAPDVLSLMRPAKIDAESNAATTPTEIA